MIGMVDSLIASSFRMAETLAEAQRVDPDLKWTAEQRFYCMGDNSGGWLTERHIEAIEQAKINLRERQ